MPPRSLYILSGPLRYDYTHEILGRNVNKTNNVEKVLDGSIDIDNKYNDIVIDRRLSIMFRDEKV